VFQPAVVGFDRIVGEPFDVMPGRRDQLVEHPRVDRGGVGDHLARDDLQHRECPGEEPAGRSGVTVGRDQHVDDLPVLINRPIDVPPPAADLHVRLVDEPPVAGRVPGEPGRVG